MSWIDDIVSDLLAIKKNFGSCFLLFCYSIKYCLFVGSIWNLLWSSEIFEHIFVFFFLHSNPLLPKVVNAQKYAISFFGCLCLCLPNWCVCIRCVREKSHSVGRIYSYWRDSVRLCRFCYCCLYLQVRSAEKCMHDLCWCTDKFLLWLKLYFINIGNYIEQSTCCHNVIFYDCFIIRQEKKRCFWIVLMPKRWKKLFIVFTLQRGHCNMLIIIFITFAAVSMPKYTLLFPSLDRNCIE